MMEDEKFSIVRLVKVNDSENSECFIIALCLEQAESIIFYVCYKNHHHVFLRSNLSFRSLVNGGASNKLGKKSIIVSNCIQIYLQCILPSDCNTFNAVYIISRWWGENIEFISEDCT